MYIHFKKIKIKRRIRKKDNNPNPRELTLEKH
jgi:hypothetical protein